MWKHLPQKQKLPFIKQAEKSLCHDRKKGIHLQDGFSNFRKINMPELTKKEK
jgi:hypothetical protein